MTLNILCEASRLNVTVLIYQESWSEPKATTLPVAILPP